MKFVKKLGVTNILLMKGKQISAQQLLERFLFSRKKQYDFVEKLSGGERKRLGFTNLYLEINGVDTLDS